MFVVAQSPYAQQLETVAPGVLNIINSTQATNETWDATLTRLLPALTATEQQKTLLVSIANRASSGLPPDPNLLGNSPKINYLIVGAAVIALFFLLRKLTRKK
ncbi:MAG: hypothetical protein IPO08_23530 [Xanthomonadales bacterium]|nr:hypothetical protein [Xanthomonadales bacterium]